MLCNCSIIRNLNKQTSCFLFGINLTLILQLKKEWDDRCWNMGLWRLGVDKRVSRLTKKLYILKCLSFIITGQTKLHFLTLHILKHFHMNKLNNKAIEFINIKQKDIPKFDIKLHYLPWKYNIWFSYTFIAYSTIFQNRLYAIHSSTACTTFYSGGKTETTASD